MLVKSHTETTKKGKASNWNFVGDWAIINQAKITVNIGFKLFIANALVTDILWIASTQNIFEIPKTKIPFKKWDIKSE